MAALDFPNSPVLDQVYTANGASFKWDGAVWRTVSSTFINDGSFVYYDGPLNVGVGTTTPASTLEVAGTITATNFSGSGASLIGVDAETLDGLDSTQFLRADANDSFTGTELIIAGQLTANGHLVFESGDHRITNNDGGGNFNIRVGHKYNNGDKLTTAGQGGMHMLFNHEQANPTFTLKFSDDHTGDAEGDAMTWRKQLTLRADGEFTWGSDAVWHAGNDGSGSGLDADLLDGLQSTQFLRSDQSDTMTGVLTIETDSYEQLKLERTNGAQLAIKFTHPTYSRYMGLGSDGEPYWSSVANITASGDQMWHEGNDGAGSGLDADLLDGQHASSFLRSDANDSFTGNYLTIETDGSQNGRIKFDNTTTSAIPYEFYQDTNGHMNFVKSGTNGAEMQLQSNDTDYTSAFLLVGGNRVLTTADVGAGGVTDADTVDGLHADQFIRSDAPDDFVGPLNFTPDTGTIIAVDNQSLLERLNQRGAVRLGHDDGVYIGGGEAGNAMVSNTSVSDERVHIGAENGINFYSFPNNSTSWGNRNEMTFDAAGILTTPSDVVVGGDLTVNGDRITGERFNTNRSHAVIEKFMANPASEPGALDDVRILNDLAGADKWGSITYTDAYLDDRTTDLGNNNAANQKMFDGTGSFQQIYQNAALDPVVIELDISQNELIYTAAVGIVFSNTVWRAKSVKIETFRNGAWQTECDLTNQLDNIVSRQVAGNDNNGITKIRYTLDDFENTNQQFMRIQSLFAINYRAGDNPHGGVHYLERYVDDQRHWNDIAPATNNTYHLGTSDLRYQAVYTTDLSIDQVKVTSSTITTSSTSQATIATFAAGVYNSAKLIVQATDTVTSEVHSTELLIVHDGTTASATEYAIVYTGAAALASYDVDISSGNVRLRATPASSNSTTYKVFEISMES